MLAIGHNFALALVAVLIAAASTLPPPRLSMLVPYDYIDWNDWFHSREVVVEGGACDIISKHQRRERRLDEAAVARRRRRSVLTGRRLCIRA